MEFEWTCCRCSQSNSTCTRCNCNHSYCNICANILTPSSCPSQSPVSTIPSCGYTSSSSGSSSPVLPYASLYDDARPRSTPHGMGILNSTHPCNQLSLIAPFYDSVPPPTSARSHHHNHQMGTVTTISSNGGSVSRRRHLIRPRLSISHFKGLWSSNSSSCDDQSDDERETFSHHSGGRKHSNSISRVDRWWLQL
ncbi:hypothetical protein TWF679_004632 [Orbilia oligospora]|uniref:RING-type domain-containing protein n=1 Tax=Orbilia oligospora TaxID=2813651 RepID=A0A8H8VDT5_ORBOL|nr:hypothetical protein TWF679_004632 [Orbilia oligospora]